MATRDLDHDAGQASISEQIEPGAPPPPAALRDTLRAFATGVTVITTRAASGAMVGLTVNSFSSVSLDPPLVLWSLRRNSPLLDVFQAAGRFAVNVLAEDQVELSKRFASPTLDRFHGIEVEISSSGLPLLFAASAQLECTLEASHSGGDHIIFIGRVCACRTSGRVPLVFALGDYRRLRLEGDRMANTHSSL